MQFVSTHGGPPPVGLSTALRRGLAPDGGLYVPQEWPAKLPPELPAEEALAPLAPLAAKFLAPFASGDALAAPLVALEGERLGVLELFHGPTAAFKDFGARFLAAAFTQLREDAARPLQILVATSGDTGGAVAAAFHGRSGIEVAVLFPLGLVSPTQQQQLSCWGGNVRTLAVRGSFDDCQRLVKQAFVDAALRERWELSSANSINIGRLLPQT